MVRDIAPRVGEPFAPDGVRWTPVSARLASLRRIGVAVPMALLAALLIGAGRWLAADGYDGSVGMGLLTWAALLPLAFLAWAWWLIGRQVGSISYAERDDDLLIRHGIMWRSLVVVPYGRLQYVDVETGPVARLFGIASVQLHTASAGSHARIPGLLPAEASRLRDQLASRGQARLAGL
jgi:membrane protein YdbS with pleckstrin-like domain